MLAQAESKTMANPNNQFSEEIESPSRLAIVVPCYNEEEIIETTVQTISNYLTQLKKSKTIANSSFICFVDDGSKDSTLEKLVFLQNKYVGIHIVKLSKNFGHQAALLAGLEHCTEICDCAVTMDADLQDDIEAIEEMVLKYNSGSEVVYGVRNDRVTDSFFKKTTAKLFYNLMNLLGASTVKNHADFRLLSTRAILFLFEYKEVNLFLRGIITKIGLRSDFVYYKRNERSAGETKYPLKKMIGFAIDGITSFSVKPLRIVTSLGLLIILISLIVGIYILLSISSQSNVRGWASLIVSIWFIGGIQLFCIGILGEYIGKIYNESKNRPRYQIEHIFTK